MKTIMRTTLGLLSALLATMPAFAESRVSFNRDIRPIMADTCFRCHGPDKNSRMAGMRLDLRDEAVKPTKSGVTPIVPGKPDESAIIARIFSPTVAKIMPPQYAHKELTAAQKETIRRWVAEGAVYEGHWAYIPVKRPAVPSGGNPIDAFIEARLTQEGLKPNPEADRRTLIRRVSLDLTGLPPSRADVDAFLADQSATAYEKVVDRLLASPAFAEKQAMHWLDAVRYADTCGFHGDNLTPAWPFRDYVLRAFRDNKPFDEFTREQLAGDLLPDATTEQRVASAYNRLTRTSAEGGLQPKEYLAKYGADRVRTTSVVWMGSTMGCAECHDHKFDPFKAKDFYAMKAFFADIKETGLMPDRGPKAWGTQLALATPEQQKKLDGLNARLEEVRGKIAQYAPTPEWEKETLRRFDAGDLSWRFQRPIEASSAQGAKLTIYNDESADSLYDFGGSMVMEKKPGNGLVVVSGANPDNDTYTLKFKPGAGEWTALGLEVVEDESLPGSKVARGADRFVLTELEALAGARKLKFSLATEQVVINTPASGPMGAIDGDPKTGWGLLSFSEPSNPFLAARFSEKLRTTADTVVTLRLHFDSTFRRATMGRMRFALSTAEHSWPGIGSIGSRQSDRKQNGLTSAVETALRTDPEKRTVEQRKEIAAYYQWASAEAQPLVIEAGNLQTEIGRVQSEIPRVLVTESTEPAVTRILARGNFLDESGEVVEPAIPGFLGKVAPGRRATRLDLANWLVSPENPLTARVFVNRTWREFFGTGISKTLDDLGSQGEWPTHPELVDWLAAEFMHPEWDAAGAHAWDVKHLIRTIVMSRTYRESSESNADIDAKDPYNRLLARQNRVRVDAENVRDIALSVSGLLVDKFGGPSVKPVEPDGYLAALNFPKREWSASHGDDLYRRGLYTQWQRTFLYPSLATFDAPSREECTVNRTNSNTPLQALVLLNDPVFVEASRGFAQKILKEGGSGVNAQIDWAFERALSRKPNEQERTILLNLQKSSLSEFQASPQAARALIQTGEAPVAKDIPAPALAAMTNVARAILNLHETITRN